MYDDDAADSDDTFEIRRSKLSMAGKQARRAEGSSLSTASSDTPKRPTPLRPTSFQAQLADAAESPSGTPSSNLYTSNYLEELRSSTPTTRPRTVSPATTQSTGPGTRIDDPMVAQTSRIALEDHADDALARAKFAADFAHDAIPSERVIRAAKEKRAKLRAAALTTKSDDFIPLEPFSKSSSALKMYNGMEVDNGPHPHSRLQREEDELGDGEDEFAEFTGATERIPIGEKATREWEERQRREMEAAVQGDIDEDLGGLEEMDEDEQEWERAQLRRTQTSHPQSREASPFRPAPIPASIPLPSVGTCSTRLELTLRALEQSIAASTSVIDSAANELETIEATEKENKLDVAVVEDKASWFNELDEFVASLARFMEEKVAKLEEVEVQALELLRRRNRILSSIRANWLDNKLKICLDIVPTKSAVVDPRENQADPSMDTTDDAPVETQTLSVSQLDHLSPADELSFTLAQREIVSNLSSIFADVQAPEYLDPACRAADTTSTMIPTLPFVSNRNITADLHPRSIVSRFQEWRRLYPEEYAQVWGGLSLAQIWEFYARLELVPWSALQRASEPKQSAWREGAATIAHFGWFTGASDYTDRARVTTGELAAGDDEVLSSLISNVLVKHLIELSRGAFSPWSAEQTGQAVEAVDLVQTVLGAENATSVSLVEAFLSVFRVEIEHLSEVMQLPSTATAATSDSDRIEAAKEIAQQVVDCLLNNLSSWSRVASLSAADGQATTALAKLYQGLVEMLLCDVVTVLFDRLSRSSVRGVEEVEREMWRQVRETVPRHVVARSQRLSALLSR